ncbi:LysR family transcriptional regulator [Novosphingobium profundi]|uniref:LysR family transcriptional regulator n=1 Tax=Novosphingobium profundi TaxID=1774954 RepID=UPI0021F5516C|nr:LysR family transcriptional regulator [Novosphingobium profundi]
MRYFVVVGRLGSIRKAADELNIAASAIDRQILNVEAELGMPLFERLSSGMRLTAAGELLMASGMRWEKNLADTLSQIEDLRGIKRGHVEIAVIEALAKGHVPRLVKAIDARFPGISIGLRVRENEEVRDAVLDASVDFGIMLEPQSTRDLTVRAFAEVALGFVTRADDPFAASDSVRFTACADRDLVVPSEPLAVAAQVRMLEATTGVLIRQRMESDNVQMIVSLALEGAGTGILTSIDAVSEVQSGQLAFTRISDPTVRPMVLALCTNTSRTLSFAASMVLSEFESQFPRFDYTNICNAAPGATQ